MFTDRHTNRQTTRWTTKTPTQSAPFLPTVALAVPTGISADIVNAFQGYVNNLTPEPRAQLLALLG